MKKEILNTFESLEFAHKRIFAKNVPFFNYRFLLSVLLVEHQLQHFLPFVKQLKCKQRKTHYYNMLDTLRSYIKTSDIVQRFSEHA